MEIFKINDAYLIDGEAINGIESFTWVERYLDAGEFTIKCPATELHRQQLLPGSFISHTDTDEIMMVESQIIDETKEGDLKLEVSGRSIEAVLLENRVVTNYSGIESGLYVYADRHYDATFGSTDPDYAFKPSAWLIVKDLINQYAASLIPPSLDCVQNAYYSETISPRYLLNDPPVTKNEYVVKKLSNVYTNVKDLLASTNSGIKVVRDKTPDWALHRHKFLVHQGANKTSNVTFSMAAGDLESVRYFWPFKPIPRVYVGSDRYGFPFPTEYPMYPGTYPEGIPKQQWIWALKCVSADAGDLNDYHDQPTGLQAHQAVQIKSILQTNANIALKSEQKMSIIDAKVSRNSKYKYKLDYDIGDLVRVVGNYETSSIMKITEHAQIIDETGESSIPTLTPWVI